MRVVAKALKKSKYATSIHLFSSRVGVMSSKYSNNWFSQDNLGTNPNCVGLIKVRFSLITSLSQDSLNLHTQDVKLIER